MIEAEGVRLRIGGRRLLDGVTFSVRPGEFVAVLGPNGAGKTTLLRAIAGAHAIDAGRLVVDEVSPASSALSQRARVVSFMPSEDAFSEQLTVREVVAMGRYAYHHWWQWHETESDGAAIEGALETVGMRQFESRLLGTLSSGERQRAWLALGLAQGAPNLLLDEPTSHLDVRVAHEILHMLRDQAAAGKTVVCVLHDLNEAAEFANRVLLLGCGGMLAFGTPERVFNGGALERAYGVAMETMHAPSGALRVFPLRPNS